MPKELLMADSSLKKQRPRSASNHSGDAFGTSLMRASLNCRNSAYFAPEEYLVSVSIQLPTVKATLAQYSGSSMTSLPSLIHHS